MEQFDINRLRTYKPFVQLMVGNRRQGKSYLNNYLCQQLASDFDLIISFMGSQHCNPELHAFLESVGYEDFQFNQWDNDLMARLEQQQIEIMRQGRVRSVLILVDDITLDFTEKEKLAHLCIRGRHFHVSVSMLSVSYSSFHKSCRRSCDFIYLFSLGCCTDRELMMNEFAHRRHTCEFYMQQIVVKPYTCAVLDLNEKEQKIYWFRAPSSGPAIERSAPENGTVENESDDAGPRPDSPASPETGCPEAPPDPASSGAC